VPMQQPAPQQWGPPPTPAIADPSQPGF
jgi:hypothetical protein